MSGLFDSQIGLFDDRQRLFDDGGTDLLSAPQFDDQAGLFDSLSGNFDDVPEQPLFLAAQSPSLTSSSIGQTHSLSANQKPDR